MGGNRLLAATSGYPVDDSSYREANECGNITNEGYSRLVRLASSENCERDNRQPKSCSKTKPNGYELKHIEAPHRGQTRIAQTI
jgi:hypothetical protein